MDSFLLDQEIEEEPMLEAAKFVLPAENIEGANLQTVDPETHARLEALLEAAGNDKNKTKMKSLILFDNSIANWCLISLSWLMSFKIYYKYLLFHCT